MEDHLRNTFFELLRIGLWGKEAHSFTQTVSADDWSVIYRYGLLHTVEGVLFDALSQLHEEQLPPRMLRAKWAIRVDQIERNNSRMNAVIGQQYAHFAQKGMRPILLKGQGVAACYPNPAHRVSGDIDWYFEGDEYHQAVRLLQEKGLAIKSAFGFSLGYDWNGIPIEHHSRLFDLKNPLVKGYLKRLQAAYGTEAFYVEGQRVDILKPELQIFQVNVHILKHLLGFGIGMRQICDAAVLYRAYAHKIDRVALRKMYQKVGILKWIHQLHGILVHDIGLPEENLPFPLPEGLKADWMMDEIWQSGNFGFYDERFADGKVSFVSVRPDGARRLWRGLRLYFPYAPQEAFFFPIRRASARIMAMLSRKKD